MPEVVVVQDPASAGVDPDSLRRAPGLGVEVVDWAAAVPVEPCSAGDITSARELDLLAAWWARAAEIDRSIPLPDGDTLIRPGRLVERALPYLVGRHFESDTALFTALRRTTGYLSDPARRAAARGAVADALPGARAVVASGFGSVVAYEALCAAAHKVGAFVTVNSPLGARDHVFPRLDPRPDVVGVWPGPADLVWTNIAEPGDVAALSPDLRPYFGDSVRTHVLGASDRARGTLARLVADAVGAAFA
ncbi:hypothetical protein [Actinokineospora bangkokensis]|uniref:Uncharacterized protein n=1 Tax=Actinokineospora bangkokensis TaxID=1193682 RepID=A0A1Q9LK90_9PSEU|nr:hypothetical protein [Actinokineospora bangkokensis]OLR92448.1 hypothetical protein BJP25_20425 [Actinokineospora bangkokensis]